jgi:hypothetical protein
MLNYKAFPDKDIHKEVRDNRADPNQDVQGELNPQRTKGAFDSQIMTRFISIRKGVEGKWI